MDEVALCILIWTAGVCMAMVICIDIPGHDLRLVFKCLAWPFTVVWWLARKIMKRRNRRSK